MIKKLLAFLMILSLLGSSVLALADDAKMVYTSDFTKDEDGGRYAEDCGSPEFLELSRTGFPADRGKPV